MRCNLEPTCLLTNLIISDIGGCQAILASEMGETATEKKSTDANIGDATSNNALTRFAEFAVHCPPAIARANRSKRSIRTEGDFV